MVGTRSDRVMQPIMQDQETKLMPYLLEGRAHTAACAQSVDKVPFDLCEFLCV